MRKLIVLAFVLLFSCRSQFLNDIQKHSAWRIDVTYSRGDFANDSGDVYTSEHDNNRGHDPATSMGWWAKD